MVRVGVRDCLLASLGFNMTVRSVRATRDNVCATAWRTWGRRRFGTVRLVP